MAARFVIREPLFRAVEGPFALQNLGDGIEVGFVKFNAVSFHPVRDGDVASSFIGTDPEEFTP